MTYLHVCRVYNYLKMINKIAEKLLAKIEIFSYTCSQ